MVPGTDLDHVAVAVERWADAFPRYAGDLGGRWTGGGDSVGFSPCQLAFANGAKVELLAPHAVERNDFLRRFLDRNGPGPHHLTFKVPDIRSALDEAAAAGYRPINVDLSDPQWMEAFIHPKDAPGVVVQIAQSAGGDGSAPPPPPEFPGRTAEPAVLERVVHAVADLDDGLRMFTGLLAGEELERGHDEAGSWVDLRWPGSSRIRLVQPSSVASPLAAWLGERRGRVHHLAFAVANPAGLPGTVALAGGTWEVPPERNLGARLLLRPL